MFTYSSALRPLARGASLVAVLALLGAASSAAAATVSFRSAPPLSLGGTPGSLVIDETSNTVYLRNSSLGTFSAIDGEKRVVSGQVGVDNAASGVAIDPSRGLAVVTTRSGLVDFVDIGTMTLSGTPLMLGEEPAGVVIDAAAGVAFVATAKNNAVSVIDLDTRTVLGTPITVGVNPGPMALDSRAGVVLVANRGDATVSAIDTGSRKVVGKPATVGAQPLGIAIDSARGLAYVTSNAAGSVTVIRVGDVAPLATFSNVGSNPLGIAIDPDTGRIFVGSYLDSTVTVIDPDTRKPVDVIKTGLQPISVAFDSRHHVLYTTNENGGTLSVIDEMLSPSLVDAALPGCSTGERYSFQLAASGYPHPQFRLGSGELPAGLTLSPGGLIEGPCGKAGASAFTIVAGNGASPDATAEFQILVTGSFTTTAPSPTEGTKSVLPPSANGGELAHTGGHELALSLVGIFLGCFGLLCVVLRRAKSFGK
ncbi:hypothetical protein B7R54_05085 [Subtercola boreus]|uniref:Gram-positive cocci surface proteins LPxTG domain-containing protein n=1 Tax=Subtercola boreus TaxID=120213 RepID=A0A3E0VGK1_9MICO|nr:YncE family protein [Subtercola boreus]RFA08673.1 hypothetical protein B7R54_05085 [Subtercola boreus]TQL54380.1 YVTN family beta-propeller protein [Subtercola boreus]